MIDLIKKTLDHCGYDGEPTEENLLECFLDYVDFGVFSNLKSEEAKDLIDNGELTIKAICLNLLSVR